MDQFSQASHARAAPEDTPDQPWRFYPARTQSRQWPLLVQAAYATHKHAKIKEWLEKHPRFHFHFTPTSASWLNQVERFFAEITRDAIRRGVFKSVPELEAAIDDYLAKHNQTPKPFVWTATAQSILGKVDRARQALIQMKSGNS